MAFQLCRGLTGTVIAGPDHQGNTHNISQPLVGFNLRFEVDIVLKSSVCRFLPHEDDDRGQCSLASYSTPAAVMLSKWQ